MSIRQSAAVEGKHMDGLQCHRTEERKSALLLDQDDWYDSSHGHLL
jgi:hypothetical protein